MTDAALPLDDPSTQIRWRNLVWVAAALGIMVAAIASGDDWFLTYVHVVAGVLWTGIDLFTGFVVGPILRCVDFPVRRAIVSRLMPRMLFIMPTVSIVAGTAGWFLAVQKGYLDLAFPELWWFIVALAVTAIMTVQGVFILLPTNILVYLEMRRPQPDGARIGRLMRRYVFVVASQAVMQVAIIIVMTRFATGI